jgi:DNA-binding NtrC family response regulator
MLEVLGYKVVLAFDGAMAVQRFQENLESIDIVVLDVVMPGLSGPEAYSQMAANHPNLGVVFTTGHTSEVGILSAMMERGALVLQKPYDSASLSQMIRDVLDTKRAVVSPVTAAP